MKNLIVLICLLFSFPLLAKDQLIATPINSPVKETYVKVKLEGFTTIAEVFFKPKNGPTEFPGEVVKEGNTFIGKFKASSLKPGTYEYRVKIRTASGKSEQDEAASTAFFTFVIDQSLEVADPGIAGEQTLLGIDSDSSNVRDDIQRYINETYPAKESTKNALKQMAKSMGLRLANVNNKELSNQHAHNIMYAISCLSWINFDSYSEIEGTIRKKYYNTPDRIKAKMKASSNFHGEGVGVREKDLNGNLYNQLCDFPAIKNN